jgi:hypothetical protein
MPLCLHFCHNESVEKVPLASKNDVFGGHLILPKYKIVDCGAFCEVIFFYISPKNLLGDFFYSLNVWDQPRPLGRRLDALVYARHGRELMG